MKKIILCAIVLTLVSLMTGYTYNDVLDSDDMVIIKLGERSERVIQGNVVTEDIVTDNHREIVTQDGKDIIRYFSNYENGIATLSVNNVVVREFDINAARNNIDYWEMPESDQYILNAYYKNNIHDMNDAELPSGLSQNYTYVDFNGERVLVPSQYAEIYRASSTVVRPYETVTDAYPTYTNKPVKSASRYSSVCGRNLSMQVQDSMYNYRLYTAESEQFNIGTTLGYIADVFNIPISLAQGSLSGLLDGYGVAATLQEKVTYYFKEDYNFSALRRTCVYDYITRNTFVSVYALDGTGRLSLTWDFINSEYTNPQWKITAQAYPHTVSFEDMLQEGQQIWDGNIEEYGYWKWG